MKFSVILSLIFVTSSASFAGSGGTGFPTTSTLAAVFCSATAVPGVRDDAFTLDRVQVLGSSEVSSVGSLLRLHQSPTGPVQRGESGVVSGNKYRSLNSDLSASFNVENSTVQVAVISGEGKGANIQMSCVGKVNRGNLPDSANTDHLVTVDLQTALEQLQ